MSTSKLLLFLVLFFVEPTAAQASSFEDTFLNGLFKYLAERRNMNLIAYRGEKVAEIGRLYYVENPSNINELESWAKHGRDIKLFELSHGYDFSDQVEWQKGTSYQIQQRLAGHLSLELKALLKKRGIKSSTFVSALKKSQIKFTVYRKVVGGFEISKRINEDKGKLIADFEAFGLGTGMLMPFQQLVLTNFTYNAQASAELESLLGFDLLSNVKANLSTGAVRNHVTNITYPGATTIAFKAFPVYFKDKGKKIGWFGTWIY
ncbi:hypothetical protein L1286_14875 [Pseudoalteromonas sp. SMS1]|uniref:hypothetical protein n=1 Tax=Pseudoalteromonas sp. SMS1 TaxID=2908894 RepID=UPI001F20B563|nr:hypothetical protein [Pseudoalteromonas sp. SMS1]MCF2858767.1 hypothetical protein [Pseudoalteromonas sp. SMS1]